MRWNKFWIREDGKIYDEIKRRRAGQRAVLYYLVALYIGYMGFLIMKNRFMGDNTMSFPLAILLATVLIVGAVGVILYATIRMKSEYEDSLLISSDKEE